MLASHIILPFIFTVTQVASTPVYLSRSSNNSILGALTKDSTNSVAPPVVAENVGNDVLLKSRGTVDIILKDRMLTIGAYLPACYGWTNICFSTYEKYGYAVGKGGWCPEKTCSFRIIDVPDSYEIRFINNKYRRDEFLYCNPRDDIRVDGAKANYCGTYMQDDSCPLEIDANNKTTIVVEDIDESCPLKIRNAKIYIPTPSATTEAPFDSEALAFVLFAIGIVLFVALVGGIVIFCYKRGYICKKKNQAPPPDQIVASPPEVAKPVNPVAPKEIMIVTEESNRSMTHVPKPQVPSVPPPMPPSPPKKKPQPAIKKADSNYHPIVQKVRTMNIITDPTETQEEPPRKKHQPVKTPKASKPKKNAQLQSKKEDDSLENASSQRTYVVEESAVKTTTTEATEKSSKKSSKK